VNEDLVYVPRVGFRSAHALGTGEKHVVERDGKTFTAEIVPIRNGYRLRVAIVRVTVWDVNADRAGRDLRVRARRAFKFGPFGMDPPRRGPVLSIVDEIRMEIELAAQTR
jgi:hypothetical protein